MKLEIRPQIQIVASQTLFHFVWPDGIDQDFRIPTLGSQQQMFGPSMQQFAVNMFAAWSLNVICSQSIVYTAMLLWYSIIQDYKVFEDVDARTG